MPSRFLEEVPGGLIEEVGTQTSSRRDSLSGCPSRARPRRLSTARARITRTKTKTRARRGTPTPGSPSVRRSKPQPLAPTTRSRTSPSSSPPGARNSARPNRSGGGAHRQARIPSRTESPPSEIRRRNGLPARRRRRRSQDYGTISTLRFEEAGGEVCPAGESLNTLGNCVI